MTPPKAPDTPDDENGHDGPPAFGAPPPPQWLSDGPQPGGADLLPEPPPAPAPAEETVAEPEPADEPEGESDNEKTIVGDLAGAYKTQVFEKKPPPDEEPAEQQEAPADDEPEPEAEPDPASLTSTDIPFPPPFPYAPDDSPQNDHTRVDPDVTHIDTPVRPPAQPPAPPRPAAPPAPSAPPPFPYAQEIPGAPAPAPAPEPFPYAQEIPGAPSPSSSPPAAEPFPYAQEIPGAPSPSSRPPAAEPFPYAQEIPSGGARPLPPLGGGADPFPYAQEIPGRQQQPPQQPAYASAQPAPLPPPPAIDEPWRTAEPGKPKRKRNKKPLLIGVAGVAVAAVLAAGGFFVVNGLGGDDEDGGGKESARLAASLFPVEGGARTDGRDQELNGVAAVGQVVVAVGGESDVLASRGLFLVSTDGGRTFKPAAQQGPDGGAPRPGETPQAVGGSSGGWVAVGTRTGGTGVVWTSENGREWRREPDAVGSVFGANDRVRRIVASGGGYLAIGDHSQKGDFSDAAPAVWLSADGRRWEARTGDQIGVQVDRGTFSLVEAAASGKVILLEGLVTPGRRKPSYRKVWRSDDGGRTWSTSDVPVPKGSRGLIIGGGEAGFLAVREIRAGGRAYGQAFASKDGSQWRKAGNLTTGGYEHTSQVLGDEQGFAAVVVRGRDVLLARSANGAAWKDAGTVETRPQREIKGGALAGEQTVVVGREPGGGDMDPMLGVWDAAGTAVPVDLAKVPGAIRPDHTVRSVGANGDLAVAVGSASGDAAVWTSTDGGAWKPAQGLGAAFTRPGPQQLIDVAGGKAGWLAVGYDQASPRRALVVTSADGSTWQAADNAAAFRATRNGIPVTSAAAAGPGGYVVVGTEGFSAVTWSSSDLKSWERGTSGSANALEGDKNGSHWMLDVASADSAGFAAVGGGRDAKGNHPSVWTSRDGKRWSLQNLQLPGGITEGHLTHVAARGNTLVAAGIGATPQGLVWLGYVSPDAGRTWRPLPVPGGGTQETIVTSLAATPKGFAGTGTVLKDGAADVVSWTSPDGSSWKSATPGGTGLGGAGDQQVTGLAAFKNSLLGVGRSTDGNADQPVLWSRPVP
ncbi:sialidase family protein [Actinomadura terrae]|uniref:sialidase family protein n=1 Tax=Actinomadura terrae TaxID=604353 RepID=UPI001FA6F3A0|nr:sialidase family protein [Actinomadura terrae]